MDGLILLKVMVEKPGRSNAKEASKPEFMKTFEDLDAFRAALTLIDTVYEITTVFPKTELYGLTIQMRRAASSIASNIAEGHGRRTSGEFVQFLCNARGSLCEVETQIVIARQLRYITGDQETQLGTQTDRLGRILNGLIASIERKRHAGGR